MLWLESGEPVLSWHERIGRHGETFRIAIFWSVGVGSGQENATPVGRFIQRLQIDEVPKLWNVLKGDLSTVQGS